MKRRTRRYADGSKVKPIVTNDPNDPALKAYQDSLNLYKGSKASYNKDVDNNLKEKQTDYDRWKKDPAMARSLTYPRPTKDDYYTYEEITKKRGDKVNWDKVKIRKDNYGYYVDPQDEYGTRSYVRNEFFKKNIKNSIKPSKVMYNSDGTIVEASYTKPKQPIKYEAAQTPIEQAQQEPVVPQVPNGDHYENTQYPNVQRVTTKAGKQFYENKAGMRMNTDNVPAKDYQYQGVKKFQNGGSVSQQGYRDDSPYRNRRSININTPNGIIDMSHTGTPLMANGRYLPPYSGQHQFNSTNVKEVPVKFQGGGSTWEVMPSDNTKVNTSVPLQHIQTPDERNKEISGYKPYVDPNNTAFNRGMQQVWNGAKVPFQMFGADPDLIKDNPKVGIPQAISSVLVGEMLGGISNRISKVKYSKIPDESYNPHWEVNKKLGEKLGTKEAQNIKNLDRWREMRGGKSVNYDAEKLTDEFYPQPNFDKPPVNYRPQIDPPLYLRNQGSSESIRTTKLWNDMYREHNIMSKGEDNLTGNAARRQVNVPKTDKVPKAKYELNPDGSLKDVGKLRESQLLEPVKGLDFRDDIMNTKNRFGGRLKNTQWTII